jgi:hypothetical protein
MKKAGRPETGSFVLNFHQQIPFRPCILILHAPLIPANTHPPSSDFGATSGIWRSGVSAESRHQKISGNICGGLPTRRYG